MGKVNTDDNPAPCHNPDDCLVFDISGDWGYFGRVDDSVANMTYKIPPRTTVAGIISAILGYKRDSYYDIFAKGESAIAVQPLSTLDTMPMSMLTLTTANRAVNEESVGEHKIGLLDSTENRQIHAYELLVNPSYRVYVWVSDSSVYDELKKHLENGTSVYTPSLGKSEYIASVDYVGEYDVNSSESRTDVESAIPFGQSNVIPTSGAVFDSQRSQCYMETFDYEGKTYRRTTEYQNYTFTTNCESMKVTDDVPVVEVNNNNIVFH